MQSWPRILQESLCRSSLFFKYSENVGISKDSSYIPIRVKNHYWVSSDPPTLLPCVTDRFGIGPVILEFSSCLLRSFAQAPLLTLASLYISVWTWWTCPLIRFLSGSRTRVFIHVGVTTPTETAVTPLDKTQHRHDAPHWSAHIHLLVWVQELCYQLSPYWLLSWYRPRVYMCVYGCGQILVPYHCCENTLVSTTSKSWFKGSGRDRVRAAAAFSCDGWN